MVGTGRRRERLDALAAELGEAFLPIELDMRERSAVEAAVDALPEPFRDDRPADQQCRPRAAARPVQDGELAPSLQAIETNITGLVALTRALLPGLIERKGAVINLSSVAATYPYRGGAVYGGTKAFVRQFSLDLRADLHGTACASPRSSPA